MNLHKLRYLVHVLRVPNHRLPQQAMFASAEVGWKEVRSINLLNN